MNSQPTSPRRRHLLIAGFAAAAAPAGVFACQREDTPQRELTANTDSGILVVSGRVLDATYSPIAYAAVEIVSGRSRVDASADADGRFVVETHVRGGQRHFQYRVSGSRAARVSLKPSIRDETGAWRMTFTAIA